MRPRIRPFARLLVIAALGAALPLSLLLAPTSCSTDAVGIDACRQIETARCEAARQCGFDDKKVAACEEFYRDQCLLGIANNSDAGGVGTTNQINACVGAIQATALCAKSQPTTIDGCKNVALIDGVEATLTASSLTPCNILLGKVSRPNDSATRFGVDVLLSCAFVNAPDAGAAVVDSGVDTDASDAATD